MADAKDEFVESLKGRLVLSGKKNVELKDSSESNRNKAMENIAEAFSDPVSDFIDKKASHGEATVDIVSYDRSVRVGHGTSHITGKEVVNLSVAECVQNAVDAHNASPDAHPDIREEIARVEAGGLKIAPPEHEGVGTMLFYTGTLIEGGN